MTERVSSMTWTQHALVCLFFSALGAADGSFVNVCVHRLPAGLSLLRPRSRCPACRGPIAALDNLPVLGWVLLGGRCRRCRSPISPRYPLVEALVALVLPLLYLLEIARSRTDPLEGGPVALLARLLAASSLVVLLLTALLIALDRHAQIRRSRGAVPGPSGSR